MADLTIVAGECGRGSGEYDTGVFNLPGPSARGAETIAEIVVHGGVGEKPSTLGQMLGGLRGGLALAQQLDLSVPVNVAASALGAGLGALDSGPKQKALIEVRFLDGATLLAMTDIGIAALMENDRRVIQLAANRLRAEPAVQETPVDPSEAGFGATALNAVSVVAGTTGAAVSSALGYLKRRTVG
ncbi:hypothetical protein ASF53_18155 [Methylobacterium sp. Leaf123]|uniref:hypothetical protein n=1 Tax=Methylobacterium sp. Leaf123 TaxID=1736264 RepID=UPI0006FE1AC8|nr:hypothetical protein [Methylobacterium sp. Leaf123]KQQ30699.1 hypothetical protein ASF53_18155 [Methylobacterium sp. Leaf123]